MSENEPARFRWNLQKLVEPNSIPGNRGRRAVNSLQPRFARALPPASATPVLAFAAGQRSADHFRAAPAHLTRIVSQRRAMLLALGLLVLDMLILACALAVVHRTRCAPASGLATRRELWF